MTERLYNHKAVYTRSFLQKPFVPICKNRDIFDILGEADGTCGLPLFGSEKE